MSPQEPEAHLTWEQALGLAVERATGAGFFFDFDGVLAPIGNDPDQVYPAVGLVDAIADLSTYIRRVGIVSARPAEFLRRHFAELADVTIHGLYGLEVIRAGGAVQADPIAESYAVLIGELAERARKELPTEVLVEYKRLSVALHFRAAPHLQDLVDRWGKQRAAEHGLRAQDGRMVVEIKPPGDRDKGTVIRDEIADLTSAWYFGDDLSDLRAFKALDDREAADPTFRGVRVAVANPETGVTVSEQADLLVASQQELLLLLREITARLAGTTKPAAPTG